jgi:hypothetical protein
MGLDFIFSYTATPKLLAMPKKDKHSGLETSQPSKTELKAKKKAQAGEGKTRADETAKADKATKKEAAPKQSPSAKPKSKKSSSVAPSKEKAAKSPKADKAKPASAGKKPAIEISADDIALRAYFIAERRHKMGWPGDSAGDWIEAERQLRQEKERALRSSRA